jgi:hypothetical protein
MNLLRAIGSLAGARHCCAKAPVRKQSAAAPNISLQGAGSAEVLVRQWRENRSAHEAEGSLSVEGRS